MLGTDSLGQDRMTVPDGCPDCGALVSGAREGCNALWHELFYSGATTVAAFDAYCMQHLEQYCASAKSYAAHLTRLCCGVEFDGDPRVYAAIQKWLNGNRLLEKPSILPFLGSMTITDIRDASPTERTRVTQAWVADVWAAYAPQHELAREWIRQALAH